MCKPPAKLYDSDNEIGKAHSKMDPLGAYVATGNRGKLDPLNLKNDPNIVAPPPPPQEAKMPDSMALRRARRPNYRGTTLTGPSGVGAGSYVTGGVTLLGG